MKQTLPIEKLSFKDLADKWPSAIVARQETGRFSGGIINCKTMANLDSIGKGCPRIRVGRKIAYPVAELVAWLEARATVCPKKNVT